MGNYLGPYTRVFGFFRVLGCYVWRFRLLRLFCISYLEETVLCDGLDPKVQEWDRARRRCFGFPRFELEEAVLAMSRV